MTLSASPVLSLLALLLAISCCKTIPIDTAMATIAIIPNAINILRFRFVSCFVVISPLSLLFSSNESIQLDSFMGFELGRTTEFSASARSGPLGFCAYKSSHVVVRFCNGIAAATTMSLCVNLEPSSCLE